MVRRSSQTIPRKTPQPRLQPWTDRPGWHCYFIRTKLDPARPRSYNAPGNSFNREYGAYRHRQVRRACQQMSTYPGFLASREFKRFGFGHPCRQSQRDTPVQLGNPQTDTTRPSRPAQDKWNGRFAWQVMIGHGVHPSD
jgi:hypothetical protein